MKIKAHAKINLCLNVVGKRMDGYHELEMIMVPLTLHDVIHLASAKEDRFTCSDASLAMNEHNTVVKAVNLMRKHYHINQHFRIHVEKNIPTQAGLAGGSADGAAVMRGIATYMNLHVSRDELAQLAKQIGADVPFCIMQTCAFVKGIGETIEPFHMNGKFDILLVKPNAGVPTGKAFSMLDFETCSHPDCEQVKVYLQQDKFEELSDVISNSLEDSAFKIVPEIASIKKELQHMGLPVVLMSGSGSCVFALTRDKKQLEEVYDYMLQKEYFVCKTTVFEERISETSALVNTQL